jgi:hypothetical protein
MPEAMAEPPAAHLAHVGGSGTSGFPSIYRRSRPAMAGIVLEALADAAAEPDRAAGCADERGGSLFREFAPHARYGGAAHDRA